MVPHCSSKAVQAEQALSLNSSVCGTTKCMCNRKVADECLTLVNTISWRACHFQEKHPDVTHFEKELCLFSEDFSSEDSSAT